MWTIRAVAKKVGIPEHTLRAWERRYQAVSPRRSETGRRSYSEQDIQKFRYLAKLTQQGYSIGMIARLSLDQLAGMANPRSKASPSSLNEGDLRALTQQLLQAIQIFDLQAVSQLASTAAKAASPRQLVFSVASPILREVGEQVERGTMEISQEHAICAILRAQLGIVLEQLKLQLVAPSERPPLVFATLEGDLHEFGILCSAILASARREICEYLGVNLPVDTLIHACQRLRPAIVVLGTAPIPECTLKTPLVEYLHRLAQGLPPSTEIWIGGALSSQAPLQLSGSPHILRRIWSLNEFDELLSLRK